MKSINYLTLDCLLNMYEVSISTYCMPDEFFIRTIFLGFLDTIIQCVCHETIGSRLCMDTRYALCSHA
jgi:hypothetical protein